MPAEYYERSLGFDLMKVLAGDPRTAEATLPDVAEALVTSRSYERSRQVWA